MKNTDYQPQNSATIRRIATYLQQLILLDLLAKVISAQEKGVEGVDYLPLIKSLSDYVANHGKQEKAEWGLIAELCSSAARAAQQRPDEPCA